MSHELKNQLIKELLKIGCLKISPKAPFKYASGLMGPLYCDNRLIPSHPQVRKMVASGFSEMIDKNHLSYGHILGVATAGITHAAFLAELRNEPMCYARSKPKDHGLAKIVEGDVGPAEKFLLVEDLVNQGASLGSVISLLRNQGFEVDSALCIVDYRTPASIKLMDELGVKIYSLINFFELADMAFKEKIVDQEGLDLLYKWHQNPSAWY